MPKETKDTGKFTSFRRAVIADFHRAVIEVSFIIFLFYSNLLMGEFTHANQHGKSFLAGLHDVFTLENFAIAIVTAMIGHGAFELMRKKL